MSKPCFVFAVCGSDEHLDTLAFSLEKLKKVTRSDIWVVTDSSRNTKPIVHSQVLDISTPSHFNNHQASIYLKTGLHRFLPPGRRYCYLDSDVIAISEDCDLIFNEFIPPIRFAPDHCRMRLFSPSAVQCNCQKEADELNRAINLELDRQDPYRNSASAEVKELRKELESEYWQMKKNPVQLVWTGIRYLSSFSTFRLKPHLIYYRTEKTWKNKEGLAFMRTANLKTICEALGLKWSWLKPYPRTKDGRSVWRVECDHLALQIQQKFGIAVKEKDFQHWNGGVFLFDDSSYDFLETWHQLTMEIFKDPAWKTRDQGTLIATVWKFHLQNHPTLDKKWNLLADYNNPDVKWLEGWYVQVSKKEKLQPVFAHIYHHFFDKSWLLWQKIEEL